MTTRIAYDSTTNAGRQVAEFVDAALELLAKGRRLKAQLDAMNWGDPPDTAAVEAEMGGMTPGKGADLVYIVDVAVQTIDCAQVAALANLDKG